MPGYRLAQAADIFRPDMLDHFELGRDFFQRLGNGFAQFAQPSQVTATATASNLWGVTHDLPGQVRRQRFASRRSAGRWDLGLGSSASHLWP